MSMRAGFEWDGLSSGLLNGDPEAPGKQYREEPQIEVTPAPASEADS